jgi:hypothetical protein
MFLSSPQAEIERLAKAVGLEWDQPLGSTLPLSKTTVSSPDRDKWRRIAPVIDAIWHIVERADARARAYLEERGAPLAAPKERAAAAFKSASV